MKSFLKRIRKTNQNDQSAGVKKEQKKDLKDKSQRHTSLLMDTLSHKKKVYTLEPPPPIPPFRAAPLRTTKTMPFVYPRSVQNEWRNGTVVGVAKTQNVPSENSNDLQWQNTENMQPQTTENAQTQTIENAQTQITENVQTQNTENAQTQTTHTDPRTRELHHYLRIRQQAASDSFSFVDDTVATLAKRLAGAREQTEHGIVCECGKPENDQPQIHTQNNQPQIPFEETDYQLLPATRVTISATNPRVRLVRVPKPF